MSDRHFCRPSVEPVQYPALIAYLKHPDRVDRADLERVDCRLCGFKLSEHAADGRCRTS